MAVVKLTLASVLASFKLIHILVRSSLIGPCKLVTKESMKRKLRILGTHFDPNGQVKLTEVSASQVKSGVSLVGSASATFLALELKFTVLSHIYISYFSVSGLDLEFCLLILLKPGDLETVHEPGVVGGQFYAPNFAPKSQYFHILVSCGRGRGGCLDNHCHCPPRASSSSPSSSSRGQSRPAAGKA